jgi:hypothetical protein
MDSFKLLPRKFQTALKLSLQDWWVLTQAWFVLLLFDLGLRLMGFPKLQTWTKETRARTSSRSPAEKAPTIQHTRKLLDIASRNHLYTMTCLRRSLALQWMLARSGIHTELRFGARKENGVLSAHAWLEHDGIPIGEPEVVTERFEVLS